MPPKSWHTRREKEMIRRFGGTPKQQYGVDGELGGRPVEARVARRDHRFRLGRDVHETLLEEGGSYLFDVEGDGKPPRRMSARAVDRMMGPGEWFEDRSYPHRFLPTDKVFGGTPGSEFDVDLDSLELELDDLL